MSIRFIIGGARGRITASNTENDFNNSNNTTSTFNDIDFGADTPDRAIYVWCGSDGDTAGNLDGVGAVQVGGVNATKVSPGNTNSGDLVSGWFRATGVSGTSGTVRVQHTQGRYNSVIFVYAVYGASTTLYDSAAIASASVPSAPSRQVDVLDGGLVLFGLTVGGGFNTVSSNVGTVVEQDPSDGTMAAGFWLPTADVLNQAITLSLTSESGNYKYDVISLQPA